MSSISIVIPCRNGARWLAQTIRSALNQTLPPDEIIVVDDGSIDDSGAIAEAFGEPVRLVEGPAKGAAHARNHGAALVNGERLMFLDADDLLTPSTLAALARALDANEDAGWAICRWDRYEFAGFGWIAAPATADLPRPGQDRLAAWLTGSWSPPCCILWNRAAYDRSGGWMPEAGLDDDGNLARRALARGIAAVDAADGLALYRRLPGEHHSYSARRLEPFGLHSRFASLADTAAELKRAGTLRRYRKPLGEALGTLLEDAKSKPSLECEIGDLVQSIGARPLRSSPPTGLGRLGARGLAWLRERRAPSIAATLSGRANRATPSKAEIAPESADRALISVIIPTFNRAALVERAVDSVLAQTHRKLEVIVVDDGSTDETAARLARIEDSRLKVVWQDNGGVAAARNAGIAKASGEYVSFLDSDDEWCSDKLARQLATLCAAPRNVGMCATGGVVVRGSGEPDKRRSPEGQLFEQLLLENTLFCCVGILVRREVIDAVGGFDPELPAIEDWDWLQRAAKLYDVVSVDDPLIVYHDARQEDRRSAHFQANMQAREMLWRRNRHALRRAGLAHLYLLGSARRELREEEGSAARGRRLVLRALAERPQSADLWPWVPFMLASSKMRAALRAVDARMRTTVVGGLLRGEQSN